MWSLIIWKGKLIDGLPCIPFILSYFIFLVVFLCMLMLPLRYHISGWTVSANLTWAISGVPSLFHASLDADMSGRCADEHPYRVQKHVRV